MYHLKIFTFLVLTLSLLSCENFLFDKDTKEGNGTIIEMPFDYTGFTKVETGWACESTISYADTFSIRIWIDQNLASDLEVHKSMNTLEIELDERYNYRNFTFEAEITLPHVQEVELSGASMSTVTGFDEDQDVDLDCSGASRILGSLNSQDLNVELSGASRLNLAGSGGDLEISASGASTVDLETFSAVNADIELSGASMATINIS
ncbi:MAG: DUF2807 domain-containing protein, partial [FCB group bacterium]|nr:DUF2807 domain-containing protein [FCB group bacterium]